jgi:hypothetical protein
MLCGTSLVFCPWWVCWPANLEQYLLVVRLLHVLYFFGHLGGFAPSHFAFLLFVLPNNE